MEHFGGWILQNSQRQFAGFFGGAFFVITATCWPQVALQFIDGFAPQQGQQFEFLTATGLTDISGAEFEVRNLAPGFLFDITPSAGGIMMFRFTAGG